MVAAREDLSVRTIRKTTPLLCVSVAALLLCATVSCDDIADLPANFSPVAKFEYAPPTPNVNSPVLFDANRSFDADGIIISYQWSFGDETGATGVSATNSFGGIGTYYVDLTVMDDDGASGRVTRSVVVPFAGGPSLPEGLRISDLEFRGSDPAQEFVELTAYYGTDLFGCRLVSRTGYQFIFSEHVMLDAGDTVRIYSGAGVSSGNTFYWGAPSEIWPDDAGEASLYRSVGVQSAQIQIDHWEYEQSS
jgi:hypothetical protein